MPQAATIANLIGQRLKTEMKLRGVSSAKLATSAGVKTSFIYDVISGKSANPSTVKLARVADCLGVSLKSLVDTGSEPVLATPSPDFISIPYLQSETSPPAQNETQPYCFHKNWLHQQFGPHTEQLRQLHISGDGMEPTLCHGDMLLVDTASQLPSPPGIFIIYDGFALTPKRLELLAQHQPPRLRIISDNPQYTSYEKSLDDIRIIGRVVWFARAA